MARLDDLIRMREVLFHALDGDRLLQRNAKEGGQTSFSEAAAGLVRELRAVTRELGPVARLDDLIRMREVLFHALDGDRLLQRNAKEGGQTSFSEAAAGLVRELRAVTRELDKLIGGDAEEVPTVDEIAARRAARLSNAGDPAQSARRGQPRRRGGGDRAS